MKYHYYSMRILQYMDLNQKFNQSVTDVHTDGWTRVTLHVYVSSTFVTGHNNMLNVPPWNMNIGNNKIIEKRKKYAQCKGTSI